MKFICKKFNKTERVWIGLGSNLSNPRKQANRAIWALSTLPMTQIIAVSSYYSSKPLGNKIQPNFLNAIIILDTGLSPETLLDYTQYIEKQQGRIRTPNTIGSWQSRTLDLDILLFGKYTIYTDNLLIPHHGLFSREFVIYPLLELDKYFVFPNNKIITDFIKIIPKNNLMLWKN
ncbi:2-amino-4-hydroxy-6-hydroxymethyldihydropteridine diphosphokinase [Candidatus Blochmannia ocreatus (nom. nud.)]|uniref:2-amino-4-hydroxy-6-hydroxymethyldihydropteridine pyrophosphokinase n=1 Tax=Candidatus Blochmannia ocreatus (nom. nud.) TaxID=251538 RepID=A0ABY4STD0_9ENTR|nr:2-amino-4-hydroxy-6-hydroxymethyldihydropteridine diphosphokinase [Candidatus Blochmannia ocreatus]URJ25232.1 2-amino-4-hydroxy-6-hydroxymethyldihydropteridine diphosphokinase [Candidatus Blochmannia ocreatus]